MIRQEKGVIERTYRQPVPSSAPSGSSVSWAAQNPSPPLAAIFRGGPHLSNPPRKTATDGDGVRGKRVGGYRLRSPHRRRWQRASSCRKGRQTRLLVEEQGKEQGGHRGQRVPKCPTGLLAAHEKAPGHLSTTGGRFGDWGDWRRSSRPGSCFLLLNLCPQVSDGQHRAERFSARQCHRNATRVLPPNCPQIALGPHGRLPHPGGAMAVGGHRREDKGQRAQVTAVEDGRAGPELRPPAAEECPGREPGDRSKPDVPDFLQYSP
jgi:hypothetical protein